MSEDLTMQAVHCSRCGKRVSQYVNVQGEPAPLIVRAWVECPECIELLLGYKLDSEQLAVQNRIRQRFSKRGE